MAIKRFSKIMRYATEALGHVAIHPASAMLNSIRFPVRSHEGKCAAIFRNSSGMAAVEFGIVVMPFFAIILAILQVGVVVFAQQELESGVEQAARLVLTGQVQKQGLTQAQFQTQVCANLPVLFKCANVMIDLQSVTSFSTANTAAPTLTYNAQGGVTNVWAFAPGVPGTIEVLRVMYQWPTFLVPLNLNLATQSNGARLLMATAVFQNEPY
jgi:Flp pilus assembly protein TadG